MSLILSVYSENAFREYQLPSLNNADHTIALLKEVFHLRETLSLKLEILDNRWRFKEDKAYWITRNNQLYHGEQLKDADVIKVTSGHKEIISVIVREVSSVFHTYEKYDLRSVTAVSIGKEAGNDIVYDYLRLVSRQHALIVRKGNGFWLVNKSRNGVYVDAVRVDGEIPLEYGAYINIIGLHMVWLGDMLAVDTRGSGAVIHTDRLKKYQLPLPKKREEQQGMAQSTGKTVYHRAPRTVEPIPSDTVEIEAPPQLNQSKKQPLAMVIGPSLTMALPMMMGSMLMVSSRSSNGGGSSLYMYSGLIMSLSSALLGTSWTLVNLRHQKKEEKEQEQYRLDVYGQYLVEKTEEVKRRYQETAEKLVDMYPSAEAYLEQDDAKGILWNRNATHKDFYRHRLGIGNMPFQLKINVPKKKFSLYKDELAEKPRQIAANYGTLYDVPVTFDLSGHNLIGLIGGKEKAGAIELVKTISAQIAANNCYTDVKLGYIYSADTVEEEKLGFAKWLPHVWSEDKKTRYLASNASEVSDVFYELTRIFRSRLEEEKPISERDEIPRPYYVLFISDLSVLEGELLAKYIMDRDKRCGLTTFILTEQYEELPNSCDFIIENTPEFQGMHDVSSEEGEKQQIRFDFVEDIRLERFARHLATLQVQEMEKGGEIPGALTFFEMLGIGKPQELPVRELWAKNRTYDNIRGLVGQKSGGAPCYLDVHEKYHGPHGLVAGTTGSGKSETLQTYMLSLAVNYSPDDIGFFIIDYKGGGMANLFSGLPHMIGSISNLSGNQVKRAMISIKSENRRRQRVFTEHGVNNINLYTRLYKNGEASYPIPHLFIIIDEFAELKREEPDFMRELISVAQVGRSLGVHLILATQKPSGTVDDNIWSNTKFRLCLRVQDKQDSNDMLHKPDAAYITQAGRCYLQVGNDEVYELFQSGYSGATYEENVSTQNTDTVKLISLSGKVDMTGNTVKLSNKKRVEYIWIDSLAKTLLEALDNRKETLSACLENADRQQQLAAEMYRIFAEQKAEYPESKYNTARLYDFMQLYETLVSRNDGRTPTAEELLNEAASEKIKLPQKKEKTQLDAIKEHLAVVAQECGYHYHMQLWMPVLPENLYLDEFAEYRETSYADGVWKETAGRWSLDFILGKMDDPWNQNQMPLTVNFAEDGHIGIIGGIVCGKSTMIQTMMYALMRKYTPEHINLYGLDFSSKMMSAMEDAPHIGGIMYEEDLEKIAKFFNMIATILEERKALLKGGNYSQYVQVHGVTIPAVIIFIDNYASFKEKTGEKYEEMMIRLSKEGVSHGIFLVISGSGIGMNNISTRVAENIGTTLCLALQDKYAYVDFLHNNQIEVLPESGIKGRGLASYGGRILEYQTAVAVRADNDYERMEEIRRSCETMKKAWKKKAARRIPEIPAKPVWSRFHMLDEYWAKLAVPELLPVGYDKDNAEIYSIDLRTIYCYTIYGEPRSGKSNFLKICIQSAMEKQAEICVIDSPKHELKHYAGIEGVSYADSEESIYDYFVSLKPVFVERNKKKHQLLETELEEDELFEAMKSGKPYFIFISELNWFARLMYTSEKGRGGMAAFLENIIEKGRLHNIYFIADMPIESRSEAVGYKIYELFTGYKAGIHFGGKVSKNVTLTFDYLKYSEKEKAEAPGIGYLPDMISGNGTTKVVVPLARR